MVAQTLSDQLVPINLTVSHAFAPVRELTARAVGALLVAATVAAVGIVAHRRRAGVLAFAATWFVVALLPLAALPLITALALYQENRGYLSAVAVAWVAGVLLAWCWESDRVRQKGLTVLRRGMVVLLLGAMALAVVLRNPVWRDDVSLWRDALSKAPGNQAAYVNLGAAYQARGDLQAAAEVYQRAVERFPRNAILHNNLGALYRASGDLGRAAGEFRAAIRVNPGFAMAFFNLGRALQEVGARDEAIAAFQRFLALAPGQPGAMPSIPQARQRLGELESGVPAQSPPPN
jgi:tetratricopeptide (TPR) repeat protein